MGCLNSTPFLLLELSLNVASILLKKLVVEKDVEIWARIRKNYLPVEVQPVYSVINKYFEEIGELPSFDALKLSIRSNAVLDKVYGIETSEDVDISNTQLLEFLKNEYTQEEILQEVSKFLDSTVMMGSAKENIEGLEKIINHIEDKVELRDPEQDMQRIELFTPEEEIERSFPLGLNEEYDSQIRFLPGDYILIGGRRGSGKSLACANMAVNTYENLNRSSIYFTIEMPARSILQRVCSIATGVPARNLRLRRLSHGEWLTVAQWWSKRFDGGEDAYRKYLEHNNFNTLHEELSRRHTLRKDKRIDVVYDPEMTLTTIKSELNKKIEQLDPSVIIVDYINQVKRHNGTHTGGQYEWTEQIEISKALKVIAQQTGIPVVSPYQIDASGEARFSKGILDSADIAYTIDPHEKEDQCVTFHCSKARDDNEIPFTSKVNWDTLKIGPESAIVPSKKKSDKKQSKKDYGDEEVYEM